MANAEVLDSIDRILSNVTTIPGGRPRETASLVIDERRLLQFALEEPYDGNDVAKCGLTKMAAAAKSVANQAADGVPWAVNFVFDRLYGKPKQTMQTTNLNMTLKEYLQQLAKDATAPTEAQIV